MTKKPKPAASRDRIQELVRVKASELVGNAANWREHPDGQREAMRGILSEVGYVSGLIAFRNKKGRLVLIDGHLRKDISGDEMVPVQVVDLTEAEARKVLATYDPVGALATANADALAALRAGVSVQNEAVAKMLADLAGESAEGDAKDEEMLLDQSVQLKPAREYIVVLCADDDGQEWDEVREALGLKMVRRGGYKKGSAFDATGVERVIPARRILDAIQGKKTDVDRDSVDGASKRRQKSKVGAVGDGVRPGKRAK